MGKRERVERGTKQTKAKCRLGVSWKALVLKEKGKRATYDLLDPLLLHWYSLPWYPPS